MNGPDATAIAEKYWKFKRVLYDLIKIKIKKNVNLRFKTRSRSCEWSCQC